MEPSGYRVRRSRSREALRKVTYQMRESVVDGVRGAVESGVAPSANAFVEEAVVARLRELRRERVYREYAEAAADPEFMRDMDEVTREFDIAIGDGLTETEEPAR